VVPAPDWTQGSIPDLFSGTFGYRLRHAAVGNANP
jgi:hypothetical protein